MGSTTSWRSSSNLGFRRWCATLSFLPVKKLSTTITLSPCSSSLSTRWLPTNPAPPVTTTRRGGGRNPGGTPDADEVCEAKEKSGRRSGTWEDGEREKR
ncbi:Os01g0837350 [Oryza sativa Japonica Group]|uniref:Os01g0837350 protein n=1 Tax=Oryza sativa subsp. japonica TaxID=39947 RepID=A0A0P0VA43_ORYSJ|nr:hypothetical protein EE612_006699 [Oryza sativa]BAS75118.1 Os01g0837350 [Oryza sativa Japonica Group]